MMHTLPGFTVEIVSEVGMVRKRTATTVAIIWIGRIRYLFNVRIFGHLLNGTNGSSVISVGLFPLESSQMISGTMSIRVKEITPASVLKIHHTSLNISPNTFLGSSCIFIVLPF